MTKRKLALGALVLGALAAATGPALSGEPGQTPPEPRLPDLRPSPPFEARIVTTRRSGRTRHLLAFPSTTENVGDGPLTIVASRTRSQRTMTAAQVVRRADGSTERVPRVGSLRYNRHSDHSHWHFLRFMVYELRRASNHKLIGPDRKTGFCLGDRHRIEEPVRGGVTRPRYTGHCGRGKPGLLRVTEGISVGWYDDYPAYLEGQYIDVTSLREGRYVLVHRSNPYRRIREKGYDNNASSAVIRLDRKPGRRPRVEIVERCFYSPKCPTDDEGEPF